MEKVITVNIDGRDELVKYKPSAGGKADAAFLVETTIPNVDRFLFFVQNGKAGYPLTGTKEDGMKATIIQAIAENESKR